MLLRRKETQKFFVIIQNNEIVCNLIQKKTIYLPKHFSYVQRLKRELLVNRPVYKLYVAIKTRNNKIAAILSCQVEICSIAQLFTDEQY